MRGLSSAKIHDRLAEGYATLVELERERLEGGDFTFGKRIEQRVIQRELLDLELQDIDEQMNRISAITSTLPL